MFIIDISYIDYTYVPKQVIDFINKNGLYAAHRVEIKNSHERYEHCLRVAYMASELAKIYDDKLIQKAHVAGIYHDIAKDMPEAEQERIAKDILNIKDYVSWKVLHPYIGEYLLKNDFAFEDSEILQAIARHTLPFDYYDSEPTLLDKIIYVSDKLEPNRTDEDVFLKPIKYYRELVLTDIDKCFIELYEDLQSGLNK
ncbi:MAG: bis(5'-nucleosyl)-tetraphosphatase (symmetrical) YqeK [Ureaplasma sp.]|nr:bis(5'-nucleosyl)-tetraphosphatase (symmetrical) YqeK [Ureaplasma sp.]